MITEAMDGDWTMPHYRVTIELSLLSMALLISSAGCAADRLRVHPRCQVSVERSQGSVRVVDGVLRGGVLEIPAGGMTLDEAVSRSLRAGRPLAINDSDTPEDPRFPAAGSTDLWYVVVARGGVAHFVPATLVSCTSVGSLPIQDQDVLSVAPAKSFASTNADGEGEEKSTETPIVRVVSGDEEGGGVWGQGVINDVAANSLYSIFENSQQLGYAAVYRQVSDVEGIFLLPDRNNKFQLAHGDIVHWVQSDALHTLFPRGRTLRRNNEVDGCFRDSARSLSGESGVFSRWRGDLTARLRAVSMYLRMPTAL